ncbi:MAG: IS66 family insertion sequence element accessory protein TnpB [Rhizomicrobium sp.]
MSYKRLEEEKFFWPVKASEVVVTLSGEQLNWLLDGYDVWRMTPHKSLPVAHIG